MVVGQVLARFLPMRCVLGLRMLRSVLIRSFLFCKPEHLTCTEISSRPGGPGFDEVVCDCDGSGHS